MDISILIQNLDFFQKIFGNMKYRIKKRIYPFAPNSFIPQYRILGIWMSINILLKGELFLPSSTCYCDSQDEAQDRIRKHKISMLRSGDYVNSYSKIVYEK